jgi:serine/threonine protein kinase
MSMIGKSLIHYEITTEIGKGGMGEVYQAKDTKLGREVAIKVLPEEFALDKDRVTRFQREAKLLASLNHPNIAAIYGLEESDGTHFLVMELIEGDTLRDRIKSGPIAVEEALKLALQMAEALEAAHENGVIHRDLKPANIKVTPEGKVKILDFGLAKAYAGDQGNINLADSPTISAAATQQGVILGTAAYMSPEQAKGKSVDKRADIWAFGVVLFEMLTGRQLFTGETASETLASVMKSEPEWDNLPPNLHFRIRFLLERCLKKDPRDRYSGISDARVEIKSVLADPSGVFVQPSLIEKPKKKLRVGISWLSATLVLGLVIAGVAVWYLKPAEPRKVMRFSYELPGNQQFTTNIQLAVSPDGSQFVYLTTDGFYLRSVDAFDARHVAGTDQFSRQPVFSPDGKWITYFSSNDRKLKKIAISGGVPVVLCDTGPVVGGLSWSSDNTIVYSDVYGGGVKRVSAEGGTPESIIKAELANIGTDGLPVAPQMLPDGKTLLFTNAFSPANSADRQITIQSLESGERKVLVGGFDAIYLSSGHLVYVQVNNNIRSLVAVPFDHNTLEVKGGPVPLLESVSAMALSDSGTLVYVRGTSGIGSASPRTLVWVDKKGNEEQIEAEPNRYAYPKISPDGTKVALTVTRDGNTDIWVWDLIRENLNRLTFYEAGDITPIWTPDGKRIVFASFREGDLCIFWKAADGTGEVEKIGSLPGHNLYPWSWSSDGKTLVTAELDSSLTDANIGAISMEGNGERISLLKSDYVESHPRISPDGRWMAYFSDEADQWQIFVRPFPEVDQGKWQVSVDGGQSPLWSPDGRELYYLNEDAIMVVEVNTEPTFSASKPKTLFRGDYVTGYEENPEWDISPDGKRFIMVKRAAATNDDSATETRSQINIVLNWDVELKQRVPVD